MNINNYLSLIGINTFENKYKYLIYLNSLLLLLSYSPLYYGIYKIFVLKSIEQILKCSTMINDLVLYYFLSKKKCIGYINHFVNDDINPVKRDKVIYPFLKIILLFSLLSSILFTTIISYYNINFSIINDLTNIFTIKILITFFYIFYSIQIQLFNIFIFFSIFIGLSNSLEEYKNLLKNNNYSIPDICQQFLEIRHKYGIAVKNLNYVLSTNITFNFFPFCILIIKLFDNLPIDTLYIKTSIYFLLSILTFHIVLSHINNSIDGIRNTIDSNRYLRQFLDRKKENYSININLNDLNGINDNKINFKNYLLELENGESIDWLIINNITSQKWKSFEILGYDWNNNNIIAKISSLIVLMLFGKTLI